MKCILNVYAIIVLINHFECFESLKTLSGDRGVSFIFMFMIIISDEGMMLVISNCLSGSNKLPALKAKSFTGVYVRRSI